MIPARGRAGVYGVGGKGDVTSPDPAPTEASYSLTNDGDARHVFTISVVTGQPTGFEVTYPNGSVVTYDATDLDALPPRAVLTPHPGEMTRPRREPALRAVRAGSR